MGEKLNNTGLMLFLEGRNSLYRDDLALFYRQSEPDVSDATINWRIHALVKQGTLERIARGKFRVGRTKSFLPVPAADLRKIYHTLTAEFPYISLCIWETAWLNEFAQHLTNASMTIVETEKDACEPVFNRLQELKRTAFLSPSQETIERYASVQKNAMIITPLVTESPRQIAEKIQIPTIEKILVDLVCDTDTFYTFQGSELRHIWQHAFTNYTVQEDKLLRYAGRRKKKEEVMRYFPLSISTE